MIQDYYFKFNYLDNCNIEENSQLESFYFDEINNNYNFNEKNHEQSISNLICKVNCDKNNKTLCNDTTNGNTMDYNNSKDYSKGLKLDNFCENDKSQASNFLPDSNNNPQNSHKKLSEFKPPDSNNNNTSKNNFLKQKKNRLENDIHNINKTETKQNNDNNKIFKIKKEYKINLFNIEEFKKKSKIKDANINENKIQQHPFFPIEEIKKIENIRNLWSNENGIFKDEKDFDEIIENEKICKNIINILNEKKETIEDKLSKPKKEIEQLKRSQQLDEMCQKFKTLLIQEIISSTNTFDEFKINKIEKIKKNKIYTSTKVDFQLALLDQRIISIISNDISGSNPKSNYLQIEKIENEYQENNEHSELYKHLNLTLQDCLDIILYKKEDIHNKFRTKLIDFLSDVYKKINYKEDKDDKIKKDYIAGLLLIGYNFKRLFLLKKPRNFKK